MPTVNSPRYQRWFIQQQSTLLAFNNSSGTWNSAGAQLLRVDAGSFTVNRNAPYSRFPVLTGSRSEVAGIRGRKGCTWSIRGLPVIPSGVAGTLPDMDIIFQNIFGAAATGTTTKTYAFNDGGFLPMSLFGFAHNLSTLTQRAIWGAFVTRATFNFNGPFMTVDLDGFAGYTIDNIGFSVFDTQAKAGLTSFPSEPGSPTINGQPIQGFGTGYTASIHSQNIELKLRALSITIETGFVPIADVYGSPYLAAVVGDARRVSIQMPDSVDDDSSALNDIKTQADTDNVTLASTIVAGNTVGSTITFTVNNLQLNAFNLRDSGPTLALEIPQSFGHATTPGAIDDFSLAFS